MSENVIQRRRGSRGQLAIRPGAEHDVLADRVIDESEHNSRFWSWRNRILIVFTGFIVAMHRSTKIALVAVAILLCVVAIIVLLNLGSIRSASNACLNIDGEETCFATKANPYRLYGTKTVYSVVSGKNNSLSSLNVGECKPRIFYLLCRHSTRYPDKDYIKDMIKLLPKLQEKISKNFPEGKVKMCEKDVKNIQDWSETLVPDDDNKLSATGINETIQLAFRFKAHFPELLGGRYDPKKFRFEFTSRERTQTTAKSFAQGLFGDDSKYINYDNSINDEVLQFHKDCKDMQKRCKDKSTDTSEIDKFENGPIMQKVIDSVSERIGVPLNYDKIKLLEIACSFGYALNIGDEWCSVFSKDELKVLEFGDDIDDYYKDAYGNKINTEQPCPIVNYVMDLFNSNLNSSEEKVALQFSHAGGIKKVFSIFGLFEDEDPIMADDVCAQQDRKWRSSYIAPFTANLALVLHDCGTEQKVVAYHNEKPIKLGGCSDVMCPIKEFYEKYNPIAENCDVKKLCCTCCKD